MKRGRTCYVKKRCDHPECREAHRIYIANRRKIRKAMLVAGEVEIVTHCKSAYVEYGCDCDLCKADKNKYERDLRASRKSVKTAQTVVSR